MFCRFSFTFAFALNTCTGLNLSSNFVEIVALFAWCVWNISLHIFALKKTLNILMFLALISGQRQG